MLDSGIQPDDERVCQQPALNKKTLRGALEEKVLGGGGEA